MNENENEYETVSEGNVFEENEFEKLYRNLGKKMREENESNIKLEDLNKIVNSLKDLYINNKEKKYYFLVELMYYYLFLKFYTNKKMKIGRKKSLN